MVSDKDEYSNLHNRKRMFQAALGYLGKKNATISFDTRIRASSITAYISEEVHKDEIDDWVREEFSKVWFFDVDLYFQYRTADTENQKKTPAIAV